MTTVLRTLLALACTCAALSAAAAGAADLPRLWKATRAGTTLYLLATSERGLPAESDAYTARVVLPALRGAVSLALEGVGDGDEGEPGPDCDLRQLDATGLAAFNDARQRTLTLALQADLARRAGLDVAALARSPDPDTQARAYAMLVDMSDEFTLLQFARAQLAALAPHAPPDVGAALLRARPGIAVHHIDTRLGAMHAYCASGPRRTLLLRALLDGAEETRDTPALTRDFAAILRGQGPDAASPLLRLAPLDAGLLCERNRGWVGRMARVSDGKAHFYVVGARHLFPVAHDAAACGGLLADLDGAGFKTVLLK